MDRTLQRHAGREAPVISRAGVGAVRAHELGRMVSWTHEGIVRMFGERPDLAAQLVATRGHAVPGGWTRGESNLTNVDPAALQADLVVTSDGPPPHSIVVEVQLGIDPDKRWTWPAYVMTLRNRRRGRVTLIVVTLDRRVEAWSAQPFEVLPGVTFTPIVFGPSTLPRVVDVANAEQDLELATLSALVHRDRDAVRATCDAIWGSPSRLAPLYSDILCATLEAAQAYWEEMMQTGRYEFQTEFARKYVALGRSQGREEGREEGLEEGLVDGLRRTLARQVGVKFGAQALPAVQARVDAADVETLERWLDRIVTAGTIDHVFAP